MLKTGSNLLMRPPRMDTAQHTLFRVPFDHPDFLFELKHDAFRAFDIHIAISLGKRQLERWEPHHPANVRCSPVTLVSETNLKARSTPMVVFWGFLIAASLTSPKRLNAQAAPGPIVPAQSQEQSPAQPPQPAAKPKQPQVPARTTLAGPWKLNRDESRIWPAWHNCSGYLISLRMT